MKRQRKVFVFLSILFFLSVPLGAGFGGEGVGGVLKEIGKGIIKKELARIIPSVFQALRFQALPPTMTATPSRISVVCDGGGSAVVSTSMSGVSEESEEDAPIHYDTQMDTVNCGLSQFTGKVVLAMDFTSEESGRANFKFHGRSIYCSRVEGHINYFFKGENSLSGRVDGTISGTCSSGKDSCTWKGIAFTERDTGREIGQKICRVCGVDPKQCEQ